jgi:serine/threonine protein kinase
MFRVVGTGQFGMVRMVRHKQTQEVFALKTLSKAAGMQKKQLEHLRNERIVMEEASSSPFCTRLVQAYQDTRCLYMLQEWVPGGELFYHLDMEGAHLVSRSSSSPQLSQFMYGIYRFFEFCLFVFSGYNIYL